MQLELMAGMMLKTALSPVEVRQCIRNARSPAYWRKLNPQLSLTGKLDLGKIHARTISPAARRNALQKLDSDGYFQLESIYPDPFLNRLREGIENLTRANLPPVFIFMYDESWAMKRIPSLVGLLDGALGSGHMELRNNWAHYIRPLPGAHGWRPHLDGPFLAGRASLWFPITDATLDNGCIYIIPRGRAPGDLTDRFTSKRTFSAAELRMLMHAARALPVKAGSILGWTFNVVHWGSVAGRTEHPRISLATEFVSGSAPEVENDNAPLSAHSSIPTFEERLKIVGRGIASFPGFEPRLLRYRKVALELWNGE